MQVMQFFFFKISIILCKSVIIHTWTLTQFLDLSASDSKHRQWPFIWRTLESHSHSFSIFPLLNASKVAQINTLSSSEKTAGADWTALPFLFFWLDFFGQIVLLRNTTTIRTWGHLAFHPLSPPCLSIRAWKVFTWRGECRCPTSMRLFLLNQMRSKVDVIFFSLFSPRFLPPVVEEGGLFFGV